MKKSAIYIVGIATGVVLTFLALLFIGKSYGDGIPVFDEYDGETVKIPVGQRAMQTGV